MKNENKHPITETISNLKKHFGIEEVVQETTQSKLFRDNPIRWRRKWNRERGTYIPNVTGSQVTLRGSGEYTLTSKDLTNVYVFAGLNAPNPFHNRNIYAAKLELERGIQTNPLEWSHDHGEGMVLEFNKMCPVIVHWYEYQVDGVRYTINRELPTDYYQGQQRNSLLLQLRGLRQNVERRNQTMVQESFIPDDPSIVTLCDGTILTEGPVFEHAQKAQKLLVEKNIGEFFKVFCYESFTKLTKNERQKLFEVVINEHSLVQISSDLESMKCYLESIPVQIQNIISEHAKEHEIVISEEQTIQEYCTKYSSNMTVDTLLKIEQLQKQYNAYITERAALGLEE